ncbi:hypothetical protein Pst134EA_028900 [Puccinia striiformis f. sp. tritici]|uniref:Protein PNS1 n=1 Tax=Puccinia striiformis f. sp. tritici PST-78 TaxID=1165861 RepID=A0A0L0W2K7_9BASI|nr:hypothetical protein Pst134EA_028900 [Puccinia striiformis f. sp. tritici]KAH9446914.1 hypothetical protein Pst134EA_028900 [Puccinia striiformis f. sp. tritici]KAI9623394.1 hypothetical protein H4Q26_014562 [Puccinia striiformis f. sp. tritici PST-130]KNF05475.1 hypothetical protein PSTG_01285 [Puccinia striiformis f. sp. tritici PST-78]
MSKQQQQQDIQPLNQSFFNSEYQQDKQRHQQQAFTGPSLSRFLSTSIINPIYKSRLFPSNVSENPLFYSTREGYEDNGLGDDILPDQDDHRLLQSNPRGIELGLDDDDEDEELESDPISSISQGKQRASINSGPLDRLQNSQSQEQRSEEGEDEDPFYEHRDLMNNLPEETYEPPLPRHLMASHALSNLMASEISYGNHQHYLQSNNQHQSDHHHQQQQQQHPGGWKMYQSITPIPPPPPPQQQQQYQQKQSPSIGPSLTNKRPTGPTDPHQSTHRPLINHPCPSELTEVPTSTYYTGQHPNNSETHPEEAYPIAHNQFMTNNLPTVYIYPTEARDIGSEAPGQSLGPQNYRDSFWIAAWLSSLIYIFIQSIWVFFFSNFSSLDGDDDKRSKQIGIIKHLPTLALLITLTFGISLTSISCLILVKRSIRYLVYGTILGVPSILGIIGLWTWSESISDSSRNGLGWISLMCTSSTLIFVRFMWNKKDRIERTIQVLSLAIGVLVIHPSLIMTSIGISLTCILSSIPFLTLILKLLLSSGQGGQGEPINSQTWIINSSSLTQIILTGFVWSWSLNVLRNLQKIIISGVVSHWYFNRHSPPSSHPPRNESNNNQEGEEIKSGYSSLDSTYQSINRAIGPSFGTVCLSGFIATIFDSSSKLFKILKRFSSSFPLFNQNLALFDWAKILIDFANKIFDFINSFVIIYAGITGFNFLNSFKKTQNLIFNHAQIGLIHNLLVKSILNLITLTISLTISLIGYQLTYTLPIANGGGVLSDKDQSLINQNLSPLIYIFFGLLPFWILRFLTDLISISVDTLFLCWNIDLDIGTNHSNLTRQAFIGKLET